MMMRAMEPLLKQRNKVGYIIARNYRIISDMLIEFTMFKNELIQKYGEKNEESNSITIKPGSENFENFLEEFNEIKDIEHEVNLMKLKYDEVIGLLTGEEILQLEFILEE